MPAVDPARLQRQIDRLITGFADSDRFLDDALALLEFHTDRVRRPGTLASARRPVRTLGVPRPVMAELAGALRRASTEDPVAAWQVADRLWEGGNYEAQSLAVATVGAQPDARVAEWVGSRLGRQLEDGLRSQMAGEAFRAWRRADLEAFLALTEEWISRGNRQHQEMGWLALASLCEQDPPASARLVLDALYRLPSAQNPGVTDARLRLLKALALGQPSETAAYLIHEYQRGAPRSERPIRQLLTCFPSRIQTRLREALTSPD
jgi:hypothetical protein